MWRLITRNGDWFPGDIWLPPSGWKREQRVVMTTTWLSPNRGWKNPTQNKAGVVGGGGGLIGGGAWLPSVSVPVEPSPRSLEPPSRAINLIRFWLIGRARRGISVRMCVCASVCVCVCVCLAAAAAAAAAACVCVLVCVPVCQLTDDWYPSCFDSIIGAEDAIWSE